VVRAAFADVRRFFLAATFFISPMLFRLPF